MTAAKPDNEPSRLRALKEYGVLDTSPEQAFDDLTKLAAFICQAPLALISLIDDSRQWCKAKSGDAPEQIPRELTFCAYAILTPSQLMIVPDALDDSRFRDNPLVTGEPGIRFYAGVPLVTPTGEALGTLCVFDRVPRQLESTQLDVLSALARQVMTQLELRRSLLILEQKITERDQYLYKMEAYQREMEKQFEQIELQSSTDGLTGLKNRRAFDLRLEEEFSRTTRNAAPLALALLDVDSFKSYNDSFGHPAGDEVLRKLAEIIQRAVRTYDFLARYGGEEFVIIMPGTSHDGALVVAERVRRSVQAASWPNRQITVSVGVALIEADITTTSQLLECADQALYQSKATGRNRVTFWHEMQAANQ